MGDWEEDATPAAKVTTTENQDVNNNTFKQDDSSGSKFNKGYRNNNNANEGGFPNRNRNNDSNDGGRFGGFRGQHNNNNDNNGDGPRPRYGNRNNDSNENNGDGPRPRYGNRNNDSNENNGDGSKPRFANRNNDNNDRNGSERKDFNNRDNERGPRSFANKGESFVNRKPREGTDENGGGGFGKGNDRNENSSFGRKKFDGDSNKPSYGGDKEGRQGFKSDNNNERGPRREYGDKEGRQGFKSDNNNERGPRREHGDKDGEGEEKKKENYIPPALNEDDDSLFKSIAIGVNFAKQDEMPAKLSGEGHESIEPLKTFADANLSELLLENVTKSGYKVPTPVQKYGIPVVMKGRDLMACAQTGSGKTAAYVLPIMTRILQDGIESSSLMAVQTPQALILSPTRELAIQIFKECRKFSHQSIIKTQILYGGTNTAHQLSEISRGTNILVATPGRLIDVLNKGKISLEKVKYFVLDEADRMLDFGFGPNIREILGKCTTEKTNMNILMYSATFPEDIQKLAQDFLKNYLFLTIGTVGGANTDVKQSVVKATKFEKRDKLLEILNEIGNERTMVFIEHKKQADVLAFFLCQKGYPATSLHGDRLQSQRETALNDFKSGNMKIIVCTSVAARGLDISDVNHVINYDLPQAIDEYVHRIGRTGRCGNIGKAISFFDADCESDKKLARNLVKTLIQADTEVPDWLNSAAEDCFGSSFATNDCKKDLRDGFKSMSMNSNDTKAPEQATDDAWE